MEEEKVFRTVKFETKTNLVKAIDSGKFGVENKDEILNKIEIKLDDDVIGLVVKIMSPPIIENVFFLDENLPKVLSQRSS